MTYIYPFPGVFTSGDKRILTDLNTEISTAKNPVTTGEVDADYLAIKIAASASNLTEEEAYELIDEIRNNLIINQ